MRMSAQAQMSSMLLDCAVKAQDRETAPPGEHRAPRDRREFAIPKYRADLYRSAAITAHGGARAGIPDAVKSKARTATGVVILAKNLGCFFGYRVRSTTPRDLKRSPSGSIRPYKLLLVILAPRLRYLAASHQVIHHKLVLQRSQKDAFEFVRSNNAPR
jgi:hypothetical protein